MFQLYNCRVLGATDHYSIDFELSDGFDSIGAGEFVSRARREILKLEGVAGPEANLLAQMMGESGGEALIGVEDGDRRAVILVGSLKVYRKLSSRLHLEGGECTVIADEIDQTLEGFHQRAFTLRLGAHNLQLGVRTHVMGILNITPDSFSDGGLYIEADRAVEHAQRMVEDGADIIDVGGESSRPGSDPVSAEEEWNRVEPVVAKLLDRVEIPISIDTLKSEVARRALELGVHMVNDISALRGDDRMRSVIGRFGVPVVLMHIKGTPKTMQQNTEYDSLVSDIFRYFRESVSLALEAGIERDMIILDPGIGFGKTSVHNLTLLRRLREFASLGYPILIGTSRKSFIGKILRDHGFGDLRAEERVEGTAATVVAAIMGGAHLVRVHDVREMVRVCRMADAIKSAGENEVGNELLYPLQ